MASPSRRETWPPPKRVRHVWLANTGLMMPRQGLVVEWRRRSTGWIALVAYIDETHSRLTLDWFRASELWPAASDPNARGVFNGTEDKHAQAQRDW